MNIKTLSSVLMERLRWAKMAGLSFSNRRDLYQVLGFERHLTTAQYRDRYSRGGIAKRIVTVFPNATWRGGMELIDDENPDNLTEFEQAWKDLEQKHQIKAKLNRVDKLSRLSTYAVLLIGAPGELDTPLPNGRSEDLLYLQPFSGGGGPNTTASSRALAVDADATIFEFDTEVTSPRFGLPISYQLKRVDVANAMAQKPVHWTRIIHVAEDLLDDDVFGTPALEAVWNLLDSLDKVTGGGAEAFWLRANQGTAIKVDADAAMDVDERQAMEDKVEEFSHQMRRFILLRKAEMDVKGSDVADFSNPADAILTQIAGTLGIPKRLLLGSEMGELASSQDRDNWRDQISSRQTEYAGPYILRPLVDRLIAHGYLPKPQDDGYEIKWPDIQTLTAKERVEGAKGWAEVNKISVEATGKPVFLTSEIRDQWSDKGALTDEELAEEMASQEVTIANREEDEAEAAEVKALEAMLSETGTLEVKVRE